MKTTNKITGVYCIKSLDYKLVYIGSSKDIKHRFSTHKYAIKKKDSKRGIIRLFESKQIILEILEITENLLEREQYWIDFYKNQTVWEIINEFDANRNNSTVSDNFRKKMSVIRKEKWKNKEYADKILKSSLKSRFTAERLNKRVHIYLKNGVYKGYIDSAKKTSEVLNLNIISTASASRGNFRNSFKYKDFLFVYEQIRVLYKLDELLELHQELRTISSQAWEDSFEYHEGSTTN